MEAEKDSKKGRGKEKEWKREEVFAIFHGEPKTIILLKMYMGGAWAAPQ